MADDSGSMSFAEHGERIEDLKALLSRIAGMKQEHSSSTLALAEHRKTMYLH